jgi:hypothetical protein
MWALEAFALISFLVTPQATIMTKLFLCVGLPVVAQCTIAQSGRMPAATGGDGDGANEGLVLLPMALAVMVV